MLDNVTLYTDVWGTLFRQILSPGWISQIAENCGGIAERRVCVNNIPDELMGEFHEMLAASIAKDDVTKFIDADARAAEAMTPRKLTRSDFEPLVYQSLGDLVAIDDCKTPYMVYFSGDAVPWGSSCWVEDGIQLLRDCPDVMVVNPTWNGLVDHARAEHAWEGADYFLGKGFSDQCYLARVSDLRKDIYHETNPESDRLYCATHGNTFEKRVNAWMRNHGKLRATLKTAYYLTRP